MKKIIFFSAGILVLAGIGWGYYLYQKPHTSVADIAPKFSIQATDLYARYKSNEAGANKQFLDQVITVTGLLADSQTSGQERTISLNAGAEGAINCSLSKGFDSGAMPAKGSRITIKGRCTGFLIDVMLVDCVLEH